MERVDYKRKPKLVSLKFKLISIIVPTVIIVMLLMIGVAYYKSRKIIISNTEEKLKISATSQVNQIEDWLNENLATIQTVKTAIEGSNFEEENLQNLLDVYYGYNHNYPNGFYIGDDKGRLITASESTKKDKDVVNSIWYKEGITRINMGFGAPYINEDGQRIISATGIINDNKDGIKIIGADVSLDYMSVIVNSMIQIKHAQAFLVDRKNDTILAHKDSSLISTKLASHNDNFLSKVEEHIINGQYETCRLEDNFVVFNAISGTDWVFVSYMPEDIVYKSLNNLQLSMILIVIIVAIFIIILIERVLHVVISPIKKLTNTISLMAEGDFSIEIEAKGNDEIAVMMRSVNRFVHNIRNMIKDISSISNLLIQQAIESDNESEHLYDASKVQYDSMQGLNHTVEQISISINEVAENASELANFVGDTKSSSDSVSIKMQETVEVTEDGRSNMQRVNSAMDEIVDSIVSVEKAINNVGVASEEIINIINMIGNIANQTNLLAMNASIEAARAGEQGRGFAVVATEIGKLAQSSTQSVQKITVLIDNINKLVSNAVIQANNSSNSIKDSSEAINQSIIKFNKIFDTINSTNVLIEEMLHNVNRVDKIACNVAAISEEQAASSEIILETSRVIVSNVNVVRENSQSAAENAKYIKESSQRLNKQIEVFKL